MGHFAHAANLLFNVQNGPADAHVTIEVIIFLLVRIVVEHHEFT